MYSILKAVFITVTLISSVAVGIDYDFGDQENGDFLYGTFSDDFMWGASTAAYQIEGAWDADGKGVSIWDTWTHQTPPPVTHGNTGDVACNSYELYQTDVQLAKNLGLTHYRMSLSWPRLLPNGTTDYVNEAGVTYYNNVLNELLANDMEPLVTLYHWDLPQALQDLGGWTNDSMKDYFAAYADFAFSTFGDKIKWWLTFNEPLSFLHDCYELGGGAPGQLTPGVSLYQGGHTVIKAHAMAYHIYNDTYRQTQNGKVSITINYMFGAPLDPTNEEDYEASLRYIVFNADWFANPIYSEEGDYPALMKEIIANRSAEQGLSESRLPEFGTDWVEYIRGTYDFFGLNHYSTFLCTSAWTTDESEVSFAADVQVSTSQDPSWKISASNWLDVVPWGFRKLLKYISVRYNYVPIVVTENGFSDRTETLEDDDRIYQIKMYVNEMLKSIQIDGCNVLGYFHWSLMDNFEWDDGYSRKLGLYHVDFDSDARTRTAKKSVSYYTQLIADNGFPDNSYSSTPGISTPNNPIPADSSTTNTPIPESTTPAAAFSALPNVQMILAALSLIYCIFSLKM